MYDVLTDNCKFLYQKIGDSIQPDFIEKVASDASAVGPEGFAWPERRLFPIFNKEAAATSSVYAQFQDIPPFVEERIKEALDLFNVEPELPLVKEAAATDSDDYLDPNGRRVLVQDASQVKIAEDLLRDAREGMNVLTRTFLYRRLYAKAAQHGVKLAEDSNKYTAQSRCFLPTLCSEVHKRRKFAKEASVQSALVTLENSLHSLKNSGLVYIDDHEEQDKLAQLLYELDEAAGIESRYNRRGELGFADPILSVFNMNKTAGDYIEMAGHDVPMDRILALDPDDVASVVGQEFMDDVVDESGQVDPYEMAQVMNILPSDIQQQVVDRLNL